MGKLAVDWGSRRPCFKVASISHMALPASMPFSGSLPAWAGRPVRVTFRWYMPGAPLTNRPRPPGGIEDIADAGLQGGNVDGLGAEEARLLAYGEDDLDPGQGLAGGLGPAHALQNGAHTGDVVRRQDSGAVGVEDAVLFYRLDAVAVGHPVHMRAEHHGTVQLALQNTDQVAALAAEGLTGVVPVTVQPSSRSLISSLSAMADLPFRKRNLWSADPEAPGTWLRFS